MELIWEYPLPTSEKSTAQQHEAPILADHAYLYYAVKSVREISIHAVNTHTGQGSEYRFPQNAFLWINSRQFFGFFYKGLAYYYAADLFVLKEDKLIATIPLSENREFNSWLLKDNRLYLAIGHRPFEKLLCIDLDSLEILWTLKTGCTKNYRAGAISFFEGKIACYGLDQLLFIDPDNGQIVHSIKLSRIDKLFCPIRQEDGTLLMGYTNWTNAGILRYDPLSGKILWRYKRKFEGPLSNCKIYLTGPCVYWTKNDTELICLDIASGEEIGRVRTAPWRYTDLCFEEKYLLFGTSGADGFLNCLDAGQCQPRWTVPLKEGCSFFDVKQARVYAGDYNKEIFEFALVDGRITDSLNVDAEVIGFIKIHDDSLYTILWGSDTKPIRLVKIRLH